MVVCQASPRRVALRSLRAIAVVVLMFGAAAASAQARSAARIPRHKVGRGTSTNWSGYAVDGTGATQVIGTWTEPSVTCAPGENSWSSPWVGIDGDTSSTVEQTGTDSDCNRGRPSYYAWYEMYPKGLVTLRMAVKPGNTFTGSVTYTSGVFTLTLTDNTTGVTASERLSSAKAQRTSVEWIEEGPSTGLLSDFGSLPFSGASATINGQTGGLNSFTSAQPITLENGAGTVRAQPSAVSGNAFSVAWDHS